LKEREEFEGIEPEEEEEDQDIMQDIMVTAFVEYTRRKE
jgi:hypothetical protein